LGGKGNDTYVFQRGDGFDTILDSDGLGSIVYDGATLTGGAQYADNRVYRSADGKHLYVRVDANTLVIDGNTHVQAYQRVYEDNTRPGYYSYGNVTSPNYHPVFSSRGEPIYRSVVRVGELTAASDNRSNCHDSGENIWN
jgi:hypothetical protein